MVHYATGRADYYVDSAFQCAYLAAIVLTAVDRKHMKTLHMGGIFLKGLGNLNRELPCGGENQHLRVFLLHVQSGQDG